jgi:hypothetical protein
LGYFCHLDPEQKIRDRFEGESHIAFIALGPQPALVDHDKLDSLVAALDQKVPSECF